MAEHPSLDELQRFARGRLTPEGSRRVVGHLLRGCARCGIRLLPEMISGAADDTSDDPGYDEALDRVLDAQRWHGPAGFEIMVKARQALAVLEAGGIAALAAAPWGLKSPASCEALLERSWSLRHEEPHEMLELANMAVLLADHLDAGRLDPAKLNNLRCRAWAALGNAYRVNDDLASADWALKQAAGLLLHAAGDLRLIAYVFDFQASLFCAQRNFPLAFDALDTVQGSIGPSFSCAASSTTRRSASPPGSSSLDDRSWLALVHVVRFRGSSCAPAGSYGLIRELCGKGWHA